MYTLEFEQQAVLDQHIKPQGFIKHEALILDADEALIDSGDPPQLQFAHQTPLVDTLDQAGPFETMNLNSCADSLAAQGVSFVEYWMHGTLLHKANEGNEEYCRAPRDELRPALSLMRPRHPPNLHQLAGGTPVADAPGLGSQSISPRRQ